MKMRIEIKWTPITEAFPPLDEEVWFCCQIDDAFTRADKGRYRGLRTEGGTVVMETDDDWSPCSHWMPMVPTPDLNYPATEPPLSCVGFQLRRFLERANV